MAELGEVTRALLAIARDLRDDRALAEQICRACVAGLDIDGAAISLHTASTLRETLFATDATADLLEDLQFSLGEGACIEAARTGRPVLVPDMTDTPDTSRWPIYAAAVVEQAGVGAVFALPLQWGDHQPRGAGSLPQNPRVAEPTQLLDALSAADTAALILLGLRTDPGDEQPGTVVEQPGGDPPGHGHGGGPARGQRRRRLRPVARPRVRRAAAPR